MYNVGRRYLRPLSLRTLSILTSLFSDDVNGEGKLLILFHLDHRVGVMLILDWDLVIVVCLIVDDDKEESWSRVTQN